MNSVTYIVKQPQILYVKMEPFPRRSSPLSLTKISADGSHVGPVLASPGPPLSFFLQSPSFPKSFKKVFFFFFYSLL